MQVKFQHSWITAPYHGDRIAFGEESLGQTDATFVVDCHRNHRGPYTGVGELLRRLVPAVHSQHPDLANAHAVEILSIAPELKSLLSVSMETLTSLAVPEERTRFYSRLRTLRLAHGLIDFLKGCILRGIYHHLAIFFENVHTADVLDQEFIGVLLRRADAQHITVTVGTTQDTLPQTITPALSSYAHHVRLKPPSKEECQQQLQNWSIPSEWKEWLVQHSAGWQGEWEPLRTLTAELTGLHPEGSSFEEGMQRLVEQLTPEMQKALAQAYIKSNCTSDSLLEIIAYRLLDTATRQAMHDTQADELEKLEQWSLKLGAIPYHCERGHAPAQRGAKALQVALDYCINMGYYEATVDLGYRGRKIVDWEKQIEYYWAFTTKNTTSLAALGRPEEAEELYNEARAFSTSASIHMQAAYATAMLYTRHHTEERRNHTLAKAWINQAIAIAELLPNPGRRSFQTVFNQNGLALIEMHLGHAEKALQLVTNGLERLNRELEPGEHMLHRSVLLYNRAQVYAGMGKIEEALTDYTTVIEQDPHYSEYYFDRGNLYRRLNRNQEALADYENAIRYSPPYPEAYYNRAGVLSALGRDEEALADYNYVLELDPDYVDALINRASMLYERGELEAARRDVAHGLTLRPDNAQLLSTLGLIAMAEERSEEAQQAFTAALEHDPSLVAAWTNRAVLFFEQGNIKAAITDLTHALELAQNATVLYNRGLAYQAREQWQQAIDDYNQALALDRTDMQDILYQRGVCYFQLGNKEQARLDFDAHLAMGDSTYREEIVRLDPSLLTDEALF
ncbi:MAG TPA: tetratricopeptide repeat protein [Ktedonosporobacter sp.]|jgi:tetratricopeptide (TPR) repeat protein|nr:tetratricopeptide repeat protein [Ktedonosporobacter sp.]